MNRIRPAVRLSALKLGSDILGRLLYFGLVIVAARRLSIDEFGIYAFAVAAGLVLGQLSDFGIQLGLLRDLSVAESAARARQIFGEALAARLGLAALAVFLGIVVAAALDRPVGERLAAAILAVAVIASVLVETLYYVLRAIGRPATEAAIALGGRAVLMACGIAALGVGWGLAGLAAAHLAAAAATGTLAIFLVGRQIRPEWPRAIGPVWRCFRRALPIGAGIVASLLYFRIDVLMLEWLRSPEDVALYSVAYRLFEPALVVPAAILAVTFPRLAHAAPGPGFWTFGIQLSLGLGALSLGLIILGGALAPLLLPALYGPAYAGATPIFLILLPAILPMFLNYGLTHGLIALGHTWLNAAFATGALIVNLLGNLLLIPVAGPSGAAIATVLTELVLFVLCLSALSLIRARSGSAPAPAGKTLL